MKTENSKKLKMQRLLSVLTIGVGVVLLIYMILVENQPGAIPLLLIVFGAGWYFITRHRNRA
jgi:lipoprotein signal peptidase